MLLLILLAAAALLAGCATPSLHPIYSPDKEIQDPGLVGVWRDADGTDKTTYTVTREGSQYQLVIAGEKDRTDCAVHLVQLGKYRFVDLAAADKERDQINDRWGELFLPTHMFLRYEVEGDGLKVWHLDRDWLKKGLDAKSPAVACTTLNDQTILITASTPELQAFLEKYAADSAAFKFSELKRTKP
jgi:hypothetical protein